MAKTLLAFELQKVRRQLREWYGGLSVLELCTNSQMTRKIQKIETLIEEMMNEKTIY